MLSADQRERSLHQAFGHCGGECRQSVRARESRRRQRPNALQLSDARQRAEPRDPDKTRDGSGRLGRMACDRKGTDQLGPASIMRRDRNYRRMAKAEKAQDFHRSEGPTDSCSLRRDRASGTPPSWRTRRATNGENSQDCRKASGVSINTEVRGHSLMGEQDDRKGRIAKLLGTRSRKQRNRAAGFRSTARTIFS